MKKFLSLLQNAQIIKADITFVENGQTYKLRIENASPSSVVREPKKKAAVAREPKAVSAFREAAAALEVAERLQSKQRRSVSEKPIR